MAEALGAAKRTPESPAPPEDQESKVQRVSHQVDTGGGMGDNAVSGGKPGSFELMENAWLDSSGNVVPEAGCKFLRIGKRTPGDDDRPICYVDGNDEHPLQIGRSEDGRNVVRLGSRPVDGLFSFEGNLVAVSDGKLWYRREDLPVGREGEFRPVRTTGTGAHEIWFSGKRFTRAYVQNELVLCSGEREFPVRLHVPRDGEIEANLLGLPVPRIEDVTEGSPVAPVTADPEANPPVKAVVPKIWQYYFLYTRSYSSSGYNKEDLGPTLGPIDVPEREDTSTDPPRRITDHVFREEGSPPDSRYGELQLRIYRTRDRGTKAYEISTEGSVKTLASHGDGTFSFLRESGSATVDLTGSVTSARYLRSVQAQFGDGVEKWFKFRASLVVGGRTVAPIFTATTVERGVPPKRVADETAFRMILRETAAGGTSFPCVFVLATRSRGSGPDVPVQNALIFAVQVSDAKRKNLHLSLSGPTVVPEDLNNEHLGYKTPTDAAAISTTEASVLGPGTDRVRLYQWDAEQGAAGLNFLLTHHPEVEWTGTEAAKKYSARDFSFFPWAQNLNSEGASAANPDPNRSNVLAVPMAIGKGLKAFNTSAGPFEKLFPFIQWTEGADFAGNLNPLVTRHLKVTKGGDVVPAVLMVSQSYQNSGRIRVNSGTPRSGDARVGGEDSRISLYDWTSAEQTLNHRVISQS